MSICQNINLKYIFELWKEGKGSELFFRHVFFHSNINKETLKVRLNLDNSAV